MTTEASTEQLPTGMAQWVTVADSGCWDWLGHKTLGYGRYRGQRAHRAHVAARVVEYIRQEGTGG